MLVSKALIKFVPFLDKICLHEFIGGYPFFYVYCAGTLKQNIGNKDQCVQQINRYIEQGGL